MSYRETKDDDDDDDEKFCLLNIEKDKCYQIEAVSG
jgi:hypothetical protein